MAKCEYFNSCTKINKSMCSCDKDCNVIPERKSRPKPKLKRVKAWVAISRDGDMYSVWLPIHKGERHKDIYKPCTILIDEKYLKDKDKK